jgi:hypothetical protein
LQRVFIVNVHRGDLAEQQLEGDESHDDDHFPLFTGEFFHSWISSSLA